MSEFKVIPAIELRGGMALKYESVGMGTRANRVEPVGLAKEFAEAGATILHLYNLDGPFIVSGAEHSGSVLAGAERNLTVMGEIARHLKIPVQVSGGIRDIESFKQVTQLGIQRACLGSAAMRDPALVKTALQHEPEAVTVFIDVKDGHVVSQEWIKDTQVTPGALAETLHDAGVRHLIYQDVAADATDVGPKVNNAAEIGAMDVDLIVTGGVKSLKHIRKVAAVRGTDGVMVGKPLLMGEFTYEQAVEAAQQGLKERE